MKEYSCAFTGHRTVSENIREEVFRRTVKEILYLYRCGVTRFLSGAATGYDVISAFAALEAKRSCPDLSLWMVLPFRGQAERWRPRDRRIHERLLEVANQVVCLSETYSHGCYHARNRWLVDNSSHIIAYYTGRGGGTAYTLSYAIENGLHITNIDSELSSET